MEKSLGEEKKVYPKEQIIRSWATRSLYVFKDISKGEKLTNKNLWSIRPGTGIPSRYYDKVIGLKAKKNIKSGTLLKLNQLEKKI